MVKNKFVEGGKRSADRNAREASAREDRGTATTRATVNARIKSTIANSIVGSLARTARVRGGRWCPSTANTRPIVRRVNAITISISHFLDRLVRFSRLFEITFGKKTESFLSSHLEKIKWTKQSGCEDRFSKQGKSISTIFGDSVRRRASFNRMQSNYFEIYTRRVKKVEK